MHAYWAVQDPNPELYCAVSYRYGEWVVAAAAGGPLPALKKCGFFPLRFHFNFKFSTPRSGGCSREGCVEGGGLLGLRHDTAFLAHGFAFQTGAAQHT
jgi:hypothetical protein